MVMKTLVNFKAHNLKVVGSNPTPATKNPSHQRRVFCSEISGLFCQITLKALSERRLDGAPVFVFFWVLLHDDPEPIT